MKRLAFVALLLAAALSADKSVQPLLTDARAVGPGSLIVSSATDEQQARYVFQLTRLDGTATVVIERTVGGASWATVGTLQKLGDAVTVPVCGACSLRANVVACAVDPGNAQSVYMRSCVVSVVGTLSGASALVAVTPTATPTRTPTP